MRYVPYVFLLTLLLLVVMLLLGRHEVADFGRWLDSL